LFITIFPTEIKLCVFLNESDIVFTTEPAVSTGFQEIRKAIASHCGRIVYTGNPIGQRHGLWSQWERKITQHTQRKCHIGFTCKVISLLRASDDTRVAHTVVPGNYTAQNHISTLARCSNKTPL